MSTFDLDPFERCGPLIAGAKFSDVQELFSGRTKPFRRNKFARHDSLIVGRNEFIVGFNESGRCDEIELFFDKDHQVEYRNLLLLDKELKAIVIGLSGIGLSTEVTDYGFRCPDIGIASFHPDFDRDRFEGDGVGYLECLTISLDRSFAP